MRFKNTLQRGSIRYIIFRDEDQFFGVALEFNLIVEGTHQAETLLLLHEAVQGYLEAARKFKLRPYVLNQKPDPEYEKMWSEYQNQKLKEKYERILTNLKISSAGWMELAR